MKRRTALLAGIFVALLGVWSPGASGSAPLDLSSPRTTGDERAGDSSIQIVTQTGGSTDVYWMRDDSRIMHAAIGASGTVTPEQLLAGVAPTLGVLRAAPVGSENSLLVWIERESPTRLLYRYALVNGTTVVAGPSTLGIAAERTSDGTLGPRPPLIRTTPSGAAFVVWLEAAEPTRILSRLVHSTGAVGPTAEIEPEQSPNWGTEMAAAVSGSALVVAWTKRDTARIDGVLTGGATGVARAVVTGTGAVDVKTVAPPTGGIAPGNVAVVASPATAVVGWTETTGFGSAWSYRAQRLTTSGEPSGTPETWASGTNPSFSGPPQTAVATADSGLATLVTHGFGRPTKVVAFSPDGSQQGAWELTSAQVLESPVLIPQRGNVRVTWIAGTSLQSRSVTADGPGEVQTIGPVVNATYPPGALHGVRGAGRVLIGWHQARPDAEDPTSNAVGTFVASLEGDALPEGPPTTAPAQPGEPQGPSSPTLPPVCTGAESLCLPTSSPTEGPSGSSQGPVDPCVATSSSLADRLWASLTCSGAQTVRQVECGTNAALLIVTPLKSLSFAKTSRGFYDVGRPGVPKRYAPLLRLYNKLLLAKFSPSAPKGYRTGADVVERILNAQSIWQVVETVTTASRYVEGGSADVEGMALDLVEVWGLEACVEGLAAAVR